MCIELHDFDIKVHAIGRDFGYKDDGIILKVKHVKEWWIVVLHQVQKWTKWSIKAFLGKNLALKQWEMTQNMPSYIPIEAWIKEM